MTANPLSLQEAADKIPDFAASLSKSIPRRVRAMRPERRESLIKLLTALLMAYPLEDDGSKRHIDYTGDETGVSKTVIELADDAGISCANVKRCLALLKQLNFLVSEQNRKKRINGKPGFSPAQRRFTPEFWRKLRDL